MRANDHANASWPADQGITHTNCNASCPASKHTDSRAVCEKEIKINGGKLFHLIHGMSKFNTNAAHLHRNNDED